MKLSFKFFFYGLCFVSHGGNLDMLPHLFVFRVFRCCPLFAVAFFFCPCFLLN